MRSGGTSRSGRDRGGCEQKRPGHAARRRLESLALIAVRVPFGAVANAELDAEIDAESHEEHGEGDRDQIHCSDHPEPDGGGEGQPDGEADQDRQDDANLFEGEPQH